MKFNKGDLVLTPHGNVLPVQSDSNYDVHIGLITYPANNVTLVKRMTDNHNTLQTEAAAHMDEQGRSADKYADAVERHFREILDDPAEMECLIYDALTKSSGFVLDYLQRLATGKLPDHETMKAVLRASAHQEAEERAGRESDG